MSPYPIEQLTQCKNAAFFFCAAFGGAYDVIHAHKHSMNEVTLIDLDENKLNEMKNTYASQWNYVHGNAFEKAVRFLEEGKSFDLVNCDPWTPMESKIFKDNFLDFYNIANKYMVFLATKGYWHSLGIDVADTIQISSYLSKLHNLDVNVLSVIKRSDFKPKDSKISGLYWVTIKIDK